MAPTPNPGLTWILSATHITHQMRVQQVLLLVMLFAASTWMINAAQQAESPVISVKDFGRSKVIGHLGHPFGTVVRITGKCIDGDSTRRKADAGKTLLQVQTVNGKTLERPFTFEFLRAAKEIPKPQSGDAIDYYVHEWGEFDGVVLIPGDLGIDQPIAANDGFHYRPQLTIHKENVVEPSTRSQK